MTLFKQTAGVIPSMEEQEAALLEARVARVAVAVVLLEARVADPDGQVQVPVEQATHQAVPRGPSCR